MKKEYNFNSSIKNPYAKRLKRQITIRIENDTIEYFKNLSDEIDIPYQNLINFFLRDCAKNKLKPNLSWNSARN